MDRKLKNTLALIGIAVGIVVLGFAVILIFQKPKIKKRTKALAELRATEYDQKLLKQQLDEKHAQAKKLDSILAARKFNIPKNLSDVKFYEFINEIEKLLSSDATMNVEYLDKKSEKNFFFHEYKVTGIGEYNDVYQIVYAVEQSKELKKITNINLSNYVSGSDVVKPILLVQYSITVSVYFSDNDRFTTAVSVENDLRAPRQYDIFYPLILAAIPPNIDGLFDVQGARLLAIVPEGPCL